MTLKRFWSGVTASARHEVGRIAINREYRWVMVWLPLAVILFFAVFFSQEVVGSLPVAVVDEDNSYLSRRLVSMLRASHEVAEVCEVTDMAEARSKLLSGEVVGVVERAELAALLDGFDNLFVDDNGAGELFAAVKNTVTYSCNFGH